jgi:hypothetical protein
MDVATQRRRLRSVGGAEQPAANELHRGVSANLKGGKSGAQMRDSPPSSHPFPLRGHGGPFFVLPTSTQL